MTLNIEIAPDVEKSLRELAARRGVEPSQCAAEALRAYLTDKESGRDRLNQEESQLLEQINTGLSAAEWRRYYELIEKRRAAHISADEFLELSVVAQRLEELNVRRIGCLSKLAELRQSTLEQVMQDLGISAPPVI